MFGREEKGEERKWWREKGEVCVWYGEKNGGKGKVERKMGVGPTIFFPPKSGRKWEGKKGESFGGSKITI